ncbi:probable CoA ligase CCL8 isoform X2 [Capsicum annuum]|uniref:probable CoA ligase CCL8 isoform X2 n=1 Tax=Capsicum annuum TaxID=4072 RepID=UPI001FB10E4C|nr:probable CoA ligase CCL8 isoform X2 [Capsicum annuum]
MSTLKFLNYFLSSKSTPLHSFYSPYIHCRFSSPKYPSFISSQSRLFSSSTSSISYMELVKEVANKGPESQQNIAIRADEKSYSYLQLISSARRISNLLSKLGLKTDKGVKENEHHNAARVGIVAKPSAEFVAGILGTWLSGGCAVPLALSYPETELLHVMNDSDISIILSTEDHQELMNTIAAKTVARLSLIPLIPDVHSSKEHDQSKDMVSDGQQNLLEINSYGESPAFILYTSGTTGKPKGVVHTHNGVIAQVQMLANTWEYTPDDQFLHCLPLHHVHGLFNALLAPLYAGSTVDFVPKFSVRGIWQRWRESYPTDGTKMDNAITVFTGMSGSSALPLPVMQQWETITGHRLLERYGMTEFVMAISNPIRGKRKGGTVGKPFPRVQAKILLEDESSNDNTGVGELCIKSPSLFKEYWKLPEVTKQSFTDDGYFKTGDTVTVDEDGYYIILGRTNADIMKVGGYKLSALEIEAVLLEHSAISECCVLGLPDKDYGEVVCAIVVPEAEVKRRRDEELKPALNLQELSDWAKEKLAPYKIPTRLFLWESLPRNAMGKVNKKELKRKLADDPK